MMMQNIYFACRLQRHKMFRFLDLAIRGRFFRKAVSDDAVISVTQIVGHS
jgi:hypothetical protein